MDLIEISNLKSTADLYLSYLKITDGYYYNIFDFDSPFNLKNFFYFDKKESINKKKLFKKYADSCGEFHHKDHSILVQCFVGLVFDIEKNSRSSALLEFFNIFLQAEITYILFQIYFYSDRENQKRKELNYVPIAPVFDRLSNIFLRFTLEKNKDNAYIWNYINESRNFSTLEGMILRCSNTTVFSSNLLKEFSKFNKFAFSLQKKYDDLAKVMRNKYISSDGKMNIILQSAEDLTKKCDGRHFYAY